MKLLIISCQFNGVSIMCACHETESDQVSWSVSLEDCSWILSGFTVALERMEKTAAGDLIDPR